MYIVGSDEHDGAIFPLLKLVGREIKKKLYLNVFGIF